jgi:transposase
MPRSKPPYPPEFRRRIIELFRSGRTMASLAKGFEVSENSIRIWAKQRDLDAGERSDGLTSDERAELQQLRREATAAFQPPARKLMSELVSVETSCFVSSPAAQDLELDFRLAQQPLQLAELLLGGPELARRPTSSFAASPPCAISYFQRGSTLREIPSFRFGSETVASPSTGRPTCPRLNPGGNSRRPSEPLGTLSMAPLRRTEGTS